MSEDRYFFNLCNLVAESNSRCLSRKIGAVIATNEYDIVSIGWNGPPNGFPSCDKRRKLDGKLKEEPVCTSNGCPRYALGYKSGEGLDLCVAVHAERSALIHALNRGISVQGCTLYANCPTPCTPCLVEIIEAGIREIVITEEHYYDRSAQYVLENSNLRWRTFQL